MCILAFLTFEERDMKECECKKKFNSLALLHLSRNSFVDKGRALETADSFSAGWCSLGMKAPRDAALSRQQKIDPPGIAHYPSVQSQADISALFCLKQCLDRWGRVVLPAFILRWSITPAYWVVGDDSHLAWLGTL